MVGGGANPLGKRPAWFACNNRRAELGGHSFVTIDDDERLLDELGLYIVGSGSDIGPLLR